MSVKITTTRKHHKPTPVELLPMQEKYLDPDIKIDEKDVITLLDKYAHDDRVDIYTLCDTLNISRSTLYKLLKNEKFAELYEHARSQRGAVMAAKGCDIALEPYNKMMNGEPVDKDFVNAAKVASSYMYMYAKTFDRSLDTKESKTGNSGNVNIQINIPDAHIREKE